MCEAMFFKTMYAGEHKNPKFGDDYKERLWDP